jgi:hypothetical protein
VSFVFFVNFVASQASQSPPDYHNSGILGRADDRIAIDHQRLPRVD